MHTHTRTYTHTDTRTNSQFGVEEHFLLNYFTGKYLQIVKKLQQLFIIYYWFSVFYDTYISSKYYKEKRMVFESFTKINSEKIYWMRLIIHLWLKVCSVSYGQRKCSEHRGSEMLRMNKCAVDFIFGRCCWKFLVRDILQNGITQSSILCKKRTMN